MANDLIVCSFLKKDDDDSAVWISIVAWYVNYHGLFSTTRQLTDKQSRTGEKGGKDSGNKLYGSKTLMAVFTLLCPCLVEKQIAPVSMTALLTTYCIRGEPSSRLFWFPRNEKTAA
jgi:hypothetical protein